VQVEDSLLVADEWVKAAEYYVIWDARSINPYGLSALEFDEPVDLKLYDQAANRMWSTPMTRTPTTSNFSYRWGRWHNGTDLDLETGDTVRSTYDGMVRIVAWDGSGYGRFILSATLQWPGNVVWSPLQTIRGIRSAGQSRRNDRAGW
jgi:murein DD-endopeptidase MepM/ murein hydrolase activator NlpD